VRLGNRTRTWAEAGRRLWGERNSQREDSGNSDGNSIAAWDAAFGSAAPARPEAPVAPMPEPEPVVSNPLLSGDPTQQLLTALGRFQRQVNLADTGAPPEAWVDNCIDQLIAGIQIAHVRGWRGVKEALTDTARILQSYDEAGDASGSVAFLHDAYEILCLMLGDLIVDNVRSGVMEKWRERYHRAVSDLHHAGYALIDDDSTGAQHQHRPAPSPAAEAARPTNVTPFVPRAAVVETPVDEAPASLNESYLNDGEDVRDEFTSVVDEPDVTYVDDATEEVEEDDPSPFVYAIEDEADEAALEDEVEAEAEELIERPVESWDETDEAEADYAEAEAASSLEVEEEQAEEADELESMWNEPSPFAEAILAEEAEAAGEEAEEVEAPVLFEAPAGVEQEEEEVAEEIAEAAQETDIFDAEDAAEELLEMAEEEAEVGAEAPVDAAKEMLFLFEESEAEALEEAVDEEEDLYTQAALVEEDVEAEAELQIAEVEALVADAEAITAEAGEAGEAAEAGEGAAQARSTEEAPEAILRNAQAAMLRGDVRDAKVLALQLAVNMARLEAQKAVQIVQDSVEKLVATEAAIEVADEDVAKARQRLEQMQQARSGREHDLDIKRAGIAGLEKRGGTVEAAIAKLDEEIARLMRKREEELAKLQEVQAELEAERDEERIVAEDLDRLHEAEQAAQDTLELAHTRLAELQQQRLEREQAREACEQMLERQRESAETISATLEAVLGGRN
jgi:hypothetical protein